MNITVLGYYSHGNYGDDLFEVLFKKLYSDHIINFYDPNKLLTLPESTDILICGGGDIINDWFMEQIAKLKIRAEQKSSKHIPTYAISIGITFKKSIPNNKPHYLDIFDYWIVRNKIDADILKSRYGNLNIEYVPDVVHLLSNYKSKKISNFINSWIGFGSGVLKHTIGIFLTNTISNNGNNKTYEQEIDKFVEIITSIPLDFQIHLVPFNVGKNKFENDSILNEKIYKKLSHQQKLRVEIKRYTLKELVNSFRTSVYSYGIAMRYHAHILCQTYSVPFISISMTNKTFEYMKDFGIDRYLINYVDRKIDINNFTELFKTLIHDKNFFKSQTESRNLSIDKFIYPIANKIVRESGPRYFLMEDFTKIFNGIIQKLIKHLFESMDLIYITNIFVKNYCLTDIYNECGLTLPDYHTRQYITNFIIYELTGIIQTEYNFGLEQKVIECNLYENILWIYENKHFKGNINNINNINNSLKIKKTKSFNFIESIDSMDFKDFNDFMVSIDLVDSIYNNPMHNNSMQKQKLNFTYIDNSVSTGIHRSGWEFVTKTLQDQFHSNKSNIIIDLYVDKTFLWGSQVYQTNKKIPYKNPWIGFIHHTPDPKYTPNSINSILESKLFIKSLKTCKALVVLSRYLKKYLDTYFKGKIPVYSLTHPTETPPILFNFNSFESNPLKQIVQIGGWLRNSYGIYELSIDNTKLNISKALVQGKYMDNYVKPPDLDINQLTKYMYKNPPEYNKRMCAVSTNKFVEGLISHINKQYESVQIISYLDNQEYDQLLSKNIVFLNLINASACNTLIECVVRCTPILINKLEAVEEILGPDYPFYYESIEQANSMATDLQLIKKTYGYLSKLDKSKLSINTFVKEFELIVSSVT